MPHHNHRYLKVGQLLIKGSVIKSVICQNVKSEHSYITSSELSVFH